MAYRALLLDMMRNYIEQINQSLSLNFMVNNFLIKNFGLIIATVHIPQAM